MVRIRLLILVFSFSFILSRSVQAQLPLEKLDLDAVSKIKDEGLSRSQVMQHICWMTDVHGPRLTGSPQLKRASEWAKQTFTDWGLADAHLEAWGPFGRGW